MRIPGSPSLPLEYGVHGKLQTIRAERVLEGHLVTMLLLKMEKMRAEVAKLTLARGLMTCRPGCSLSAQPWSAGEGEGWENMPGPGGVVETPQVAGEASSLHQSTPGRKGLLWAGLPQVL